MLKHISQMFRPWKIEELKRMTWIVVESRFQDQLKRFQLFLTQLKHQLNSTFRTIVIVSMSAIPHVKLSLKAVRRSTRSK